MAAAMKTRVLCALLLMSILVAVRGKSQVKIMPKVFATSKEYPRGRDRRLSVQDEWLDCDQTPSLTFPASLEISSAALAIILLLGGDIESNPGPAICHTCNTEVQNPNGKLSCGICLGVVPPQCGYRIPEKADRLCKNCLWTKTSKVVRSSIANRCPC